MGLKSVGQRPVCESGVNILPFLDAKFLQGCGSRRLAGGSGAGCLDTAGEENSERLGWTLASRCLYMLPRLDMQSGLVTVTPLGCAGLAGHSQQEPLRLFWRLKGCGASGWGPPFNPSAWEPQRPSCLQCRDEARFL